MSKASISNPLTLIAVFAGIAETCAVAVLPILDPGIQVIFVNFVMGFPCLLVLLFFIMLWRRPSALYAPADFRDDSAYIKINGPKVTNDNFLAVRDLGHANVFESSETETPGARTESVNSGPAVEPSATPTPVVDPSNSTVGQATDRALDAKHFYRFQSPAPTPRLAQTTLELGEAAMAERLALAKLIKTYGGQLTTPATVTVNDGAYQFDGAIVQGRTVNIVEVVYKSEADIGSKIKMQLEKFRKLKNQMDIDGSAQQASFTLVVVTRDPEDSFSLDSLVREYAKKFDLEMAVEVFNLMSLMSEISA
ncbi:hypothetical protein [Pseudoxanthomonas sp. JBR18]|uniref:hypothetical protein n=1 Tax=Pseudoxanthomonas sp. JBR18 TaxID=2969308 RepID=UPI0023068C00|nr:hypothetical protein [Pseudoxanthomonas sp. JBR18]WCE04160.1 hypothetical protein PJ250_19140 [Pseudoxanthomonas sp. JBR18]